MTTPTDSLGSVDAAGCICPWCKTYLVLPITDYETCPACHGSFSFRKPAPDPPAESADGVERPGTIEGKPSPPPAANQPRSDHE